MQRGNLSRRGFLQRSFTALTLGAGLPAWYAHEVLAADQENKAAVSDKLIFGAIGIGSPQSRGRAISGDALGAGKGNVIYTAICDVDAKHRDVATEEMKKRGQDVKAYKDFRELLDRKDINAVTIATPDHWHALVAIDALRKGKDVYCEKPLALTVAESQAIVKVAKQTGRIFQVGSQQRSDARFRLACELVRNGRIGKVQRVETRIGSNPKGTFKVEQPAEGLDWDMWLGPTPKVDYVKQRCHYEFRWWYDYSGGKLTDWGAHHNDIAQWGLGMDGTGPIAVEGEGEAPSREPNSYNCHPTFKVTYTYADGAKLVCSHNQLADAIDRKGADNKGHDNGVLFVGEGDKWLFVNRGKISASDKKLIDEPLGPDAKKLYLSANHMGNFLEGIRTRKPCVCTAEVGHRSVTVCHLGALTLRTGKKFKWDPVNEQADDAEVNKLLSREMRAPWKLDV